MPGFRFHAFDSQEPVERPSDPAVRKANLRRIVRLFSPYKPRLAATGGLILFSSAIGVIPPFLLRAILDTAIQVDSAGQATVDMHLLVLLVAGMVAIPVVSGAVMVYQTLLSNLVGQAVMHDLRTAVYRHLQRLSLAFFTRTRTGEVQSRIANDIGGIENVVTTTATSVLGNVTTVIATVVAMLLLDWRLAAFALALLPLFVWLTKRVGEQRKKVTAERQVSLADVSSIVQESLSVSGILLGKTMGRSADLAERFETESQRLAGLEVRSRMTGRWMMAAIQTTFAVMPALVYLFAGWTISRGSTSITIGTIVAFTTLQTRLFFPIGSLLGVQIDVQSSLALFDRIFDYLDQPIDIVEGSERLEAPRGDVAFEDVWFGYEQGTWTLEQVTFAVPAGTKTALVGETGSGKTTCAYLVARLYDATRGRVTIDGLDVRELTFPSLTAAVGVVSQETYLFHASVRENLRFARPDATDEEIEEAARAAQIHSLIAGLPGRVRDRRRRARLPVLGRREAADRDRAHDPPQPADPRPRRGDLRARHTDGAGRAVGPRASGRGSDGDRDRASPLHGARRRPDRRARPRPRRRARHARGAARPGRALLGARRPRRGRRRRPLAAVVSGRAATVRLP